MTTPLMAENDCAQQDGLPRIDEAPTPIAHARWWIATLVGVFLVLPFGWLLSNVALLPFYLGLFFFCLFGLIVGAVIHRMAARGRPYPQGMLVVGTAIVVLTGWGFSVACEGRGFPDWVAKRASLDGSLRLGDRSIEEYRLEIAENTRWFLSEHYPPGGAIGYIRWIVTNGALKKGDIQGVDRPPPMRQRTIAWAVRVVLSIGLFAFGVASQTWLLRLPRDPAVRAMDA